jgi:3-oxoacyl-[acyl-carrier-protein] synthase II
MNSRRVVVTGLGCVTSIGLDFEDFWKNLVAGKSGISKLENIDLSALSVHIGGQIKNFNGEKWINKKDLRRMDRFIQLGLAASLQACDQAKLDTYEDKKRVGTILSSGIGGLSLIEETVDELTAGQRVSPFFIPSIISNLLPGQLSIMKGFKGVNYCITSACSSSAHAIGEGFRMITRGEADVMVVGGSEAPLTRIALAGFAAMKALSTRNDAPEKASRPFDVDRDGFVMSEGGATIILETLESAQKRGVPILGEILGYGTNSDAYHMTSPSENGEGSRDCMLLALENAKTKPEEIDYINMHGTSTPAGDIAESMAVEQVFPNWKNHLLVSSTKSMTGHLLGAAGSLEALACLGAIRDSRIPPTINLDKQDPGCKLDYVPFESRGHKVKKALSNSFGFGGTNVSLLFAGFES